MARTGTPPKREPRPRRDRRSSAQTRKSRDHREPMGPPLQGPKHSQRRAFLTPERGTAEPPNLRTRQERGRGREPRSPPLKILYEQAPRRLEKPRSDHFLQSTTRQKRERERVPLRATSSAKDICSVLVLTPAKNAQFLRSHLRKYTPSTLKPRSVPPLVRGRSVHFLRLRPAARAVAQPYIWGV